MHLFWLGAQCNRATRKSGYIGSRDEHDGMMTRCGYRESSRYAHACAIFCQWCLSAFVHLCAQVALTTQHRVCTQLRSKPGCAIFAISAFICQRRARSNIPMHALTLRMATDLNRTQQHLHARPRLCCCYVCYMAINDYQMLTRCSGGRYMASPGCTSKAACQASRLRTTPLVRYSGGAWGSVASNSRMRSSRYRLRQACA